ncbi:MAG: pentapeptide repeat-containing protein [Candidatus Ornithomonoglobus sp.]
MSGFPHTGFPRSDFRNTDFRNADFRNTDILCPRCRCAELRRYCMSICKRRFRRYAP